LKSSWSSITTNSGYTQRWATVLRKSSNDKPSAKVRLQMRRQRRSLSSLAWLHLLRGCWSRGLKRRPLLQTSSPLEKLSRRLHERANVPMSNCLTSGVHLTKSCTCANLICLTRGVHPICFVIESQQNGHQSNTGVASSRDQPGHVGHIHPGSHSAEAPSPEQRHSSSASICDSCRLRPAFWNVFPLCACPKPRLECKTLAT